MVIVNSDVLRLKGAVSEVNRATMRRDRLVARLRAKGATWTELGYLLGMSAQGAQQKYGTGTERHAATVERQKANGAKKAAKKAAESS